MGYSLCMMANFHYGLISRIFRLFSSSFLHTITLNGLVFFDPTGFCMAILHDSHFHNSFLEYLGFWERLFTHDNSKNNGFWIFPKVMILHGL